MLREIEIVAYSVNTSNVLLQEDVRIKKKWRTFKLLCCAHICNANTATAITAHTYITEVKARSDNGALVMFFLALVRCLQLNQIDIL